MVVQENELRDDQNAATDLHHQTKGVTTNIEETLEVLVNNDEHTVEGLAEETLQGHAEETNECFEKVPRVTSTKSDSTFSKPNVPHDILIHNEIETPEVKSDKKMVGLKEIITDSNVSCTEDEITYLDGSVTYTKDEIARTEGKASCSDNVTCTKEITSTKSGVALETRNVNIITRKDSISINIQADNTQSNSGMQGAKVDEESALVSNHDALSAEVDNRPQSQLNTWVSSHRPHSMMQGSNRSLLYNPGDDVRSILSDASLIPRVPSDFELLPYNVESDLLQPIKIESDLLLLNDVNLVGLSLEDDKLQDDEISGEMQEK